MSNWLQLFVVSKFLSLFWSVYRKNSYQRTYNKTKKPLRSMELTNIIENLLFGHSHSQPTLHKPLWFVFVTWGHGLSMDMNIKNRLDFAQASTPTFSCFCHFSIIKDWIWQSSSLPKALPFMLFRLLPTGPVSNLYKKRFLLFQHRINFFLGILSGYSM